MASHSSHTTTDHEKIKRWAEERDGKPARVRGTGDDEDPGLLRIDFPGGAEESLEEISWDEFFDKFEEKDLAFLYQDTMVDGSESRFFKFIHRESEASTQESEVRSDINQNVNSANDTHGGLSMDAENPEINEQDQTPSMTSNKTSSHRQDLDTGPELLDRLTRLCQLDIDAVYAYEQAISAIEEDDEHIREALMRFRDDHVNHVISLSSCIYGFGGEPPNIKQDLKGFVIEGMTAIQGLTGTAGALRAMNTNEALTNRTYEEALSWEMPDGLREIIDKNRNDERRHKEFIERALSSEFGEDVSSAPTAQHEESQPSAPM